MTDAVQTPPASPKTWVDLVDNFQHYVAGGALIGLTAYMVMISKIDASLLIVEITAAAGAIGFKLSK